MTDISEAPVAAPWSGDWGVVLATEERERSQRIRFRRVHNLVNADPFVGLVCQRRVTGTVDDGRDAQLGEVPSVGAHAETGERGIEAEELVGLEHAAHDLA